MASERPIIFSGPMVRAILDGRKTQTRRVVKGVALDWLEPSGFSPEFVAHPENGLCPYGQPGDRLWVRETHYVASAGSTDGTGRVIWYRATEPGAPCTWTPSIHMPRWASRITLEITDVRVERVKQISEEAAKAEGAPLGECTDGFPSFAQGFIDLWDSINAARGYSWESDPWVWVLTFHRVETAPAAAPPAHKIGYVVRGNGDSGQFGGRR